MKHEASVTKILIFIFVLSQLVGLFLLTADLNVGLNQEGYVVEFEDTAIGERPDFEGVGSLLYLSIGIAVGTLVLLLLIKLRSGKKLWKVWYSLAVVVSMMIALGVLFSDTFALILAIVLAYFKLHKSNMFTHNITELLMYAGLTILLVPLFDVFWATILLILISIYDAIAVWKSKHMIDLAKFTTESNLFAGLLVNYSEDKGKTSIVITNTPKDEKKTISSSKNNSSKKTLKKAPKKKGTGIRQAILGGGDIVFPLLFTGSVLIWLLELGYTKQYAFGLSLIVTAGATAALTYLFLTAKKDRFYPAMPFISGGCFLGLIVLLTVLQLI